MKLFRFLFLLEIFLFLSCFVHAQSIGINTTGDAPAAGTILDVSAIDKAVLLPRTTTESIANPIEGMVIYDTTAHQFHYYNGMQWCALLEEGAYNFYWADEDGDGYGFPFNVIYSPDPPEFFVDNNDDCDDTDPAINPDGVEVCDGKDNDCNGLIDFEDPGVIDAVTFWFDSDGDGYGDPGIEIMECFAPDGYVDNNLDCDDTDPDVYPGADEICDGEDNDCDGLVDTDDPNLVGGQTYYQDLDEDGFGNSDISVYVCEPPSGYVPENGDCDDLDPDINPAATEVCDEVDNNCNGEVDEGFDLNSDPTNCGNCGNVCDDGLYCTIDYCSGGVCFNDIDPTKCLIDGICYDDGELRPGFPCQVCDALNPTIWTNLPSGTNCPLGTCNGEGVCIPD